MENGRLRPLHEVPIISDRFAVCLVRLLREPLNTVGGNGAGKRRNPTSDIPLVGNDHVSERFPPSTSISRKTGSERQAEAGSHATAQGDRQAQGSVATSPPRRDDRHRHEQAQRASSPPASSLRRLLFGRTVLDHVGCHQDPAVGE
jgi:hypothetical protein